MIAVPGLRRGRLTREAVFLMLTLCAAGLFFAASMTGFLTLGTGQFAAVSAMLTISAVAGAALQTGAAYSLARTARADETCIAAAFSAHLALSALLGLLACCLVAVMAPDTTWRLGILLGAATGLQLVGDGLIRARGWLLRLGALNAGLHGALLGAVVWQATTGTLTAERFVLLVLAVKLAFLAFALMWEGVSRPAVGPAFWASLKAGSAVTLGFGLGTADVLVLVLVHPEDAARYIAMKHFGYGLFLALVQEGAVPVLIARLASRSEIAPRRLLRAIGATSMAVGLGAAALALALARLKGLDAHGSVQIAALIGIGLGAHTAAIFGLKVMYVTGGLTDGHAALLALGFGVAIAGLTLSGGGILTIALAWIGANTLVFAGCAVRLATHESI